MGIGQDIWVFSDKTSPTTGNPLMGSPEVGYRDPFTGEFFNTDRIDGGLQDTMSPLDFVGPGAIGKLGAMGAERAGAAAGSKLLGEGAAGASKAAAKDAAKDAAEGCGTCQGAKLLKKKRKNGDVYRGDGRSPEQLSKDGGIAPRDPNANATLDQHVNGGAPPTGTQYVSTTRDPWVADSFARSNMGADGSSYVYHIDQGGLNATDVAGMSRFNESETAVQGTIPWSNVTGWWQTDGVTGPWSSFTPNPAYVPKP